MTTSSAYPYAEYGSERFVPFASIFNFRDLGGLAAMDGSKVRTGLVFRSDQFGNASQTDVDYIVDELGLKTVVDLRRPTEIAVTGSFPGGRGVDVRSIELGHIRWENFDRDAGKEASPVPFLVERYSAMIETGAAAIRDTLTLMVTATPMVFHCMAGKDRTGITAAIALKLLGVSDDDIAADYALTGEGMNRYYHWRERTGKSPNEGLYPHAEAMYGLLRNIDAHFGGAEKYAHAIEFHRVDELRTHLLT